MNVSGADVGAGVGAAVDAVGAAVDAVGADIGAAVQGGALLMLAWLACGVVTSVDSVSARTPVSSADKSPTPPPPPSQYCHASAIAQLPFLMFVAC